MPTESLVALVIARPEITNDLFEQCGPAKGRPVRVLTTLPMFSAPDIRAMIQQMGPQAIILDSKVHGCDLDAMLAIRREPNVRPFLLIGLAPATSIEMDQMLSIADLAYPLPLSAAAIDKMCVDAPKKFSSIAEGWKKGVFDGVVPEHLRSIVAGAAGSWQKKIIVNHSSKGGVGKTTATVEIATSLAILGGCKVILVDANMNGGHVASKLSVSTDQNLLTAAFAYHTHQGAKFFDAEMASKINSLLQPVSGAPNFLVLPGIINQQQAINDAIDGQAGSDFIQYLLRLLINNCDFVVVDSGSSLNIGVHYGTLKVADNILMICDCDLESLGDAKSQAITLTTGDVMVSADRIKLVMNRYLEEVGVPIKKAIEYTGIPAIGNPIPFCPEMIKSGNEGRSFVASYVNARNNPKRVNDALSGIVSVASYFYPNIAALWSQRNRDSEKKSGGLFGARK